MNISEDIRSFVLWSTGGFAPVPEHSKYMTYAATPRPKHTYSGITNEVVDDWQIDVISHGTHWYAVPTTLGRLAPFSIPVIIPDQTRWPESKWDSLDARDSVLIAGGHFDDLGITQYMRRALSHWSRNNQSFATEYRSLGLGSYIETKAITETPDNVIFTMVSDDSAKNNLLTASRLASMWNLEAEALPPRIALTELDLHKRLTGDVSLVRVQGAEDILVLKSRIPMGDIYHEIKSLVLLLKAHPNVADKPQFLVTVASDSDEEDLVCGFLQKFYYPGDLHNVIAKRQLSKPLTQEEQLSWAIDILEGLIHVHNTPNMFFSDLRLDNVVLDDSSGTTRARLIDFEQYRNVYNWAAPEIYYLEWIAEQSSTGYVKPRTVGVDSEKLAFHDGLLQDYLAAQERCQAHGAQSSITPSTGSEGYTNPACSQYFPWLVSSVADREAAVVYTFGKVLWCLFEGIADGHILLGRASLHEQDNLIFPEFEKTPPKLRELIRACTAGAREWTDGPISIIRIGGQIFPSAMHGASRGQRNASLQDTIQAIRGFWQKEIRKAERFIIARTKFFLGQESAEERNLMQYLSRPTLREVSEALIDFRTYAGKPADMA